MSFAETEPVNENGVTAPQPKKKSIIQLPIIIGIVIVAVAAATLFVIKGFFDIVQYKNYIFFKGEIIKDNESIFLKSFS